MTPLNYGAGDDYFASHGLQKNHKEVLDQASPKILFEGMIAKHHTLAMSCKLTH